MKRITVIFMVIFLIICSILNTSADEEIGNVYQFENTTVIFEADSEFSVEQQEIIANFIVNPEYGIAKVNIICDIFGHKNTIEGVTTITHKVSAESPRCLQELFTITTCSRCDQTTVERDAYFYISCCPED